MFADDFLRANSRGYYSHTDPSVVSKHLKNVYATLSSTVVCATIGAYASVAFQLHFYGLLASLVSFGLMMWLMMTPHEPKNVMKRLAILSTFGMLSGVAMYPLLQFAIAVNPQLIVTALMLSSVVFIGFTLAALTAKHGKWLYLGGVLFSALSFLLVGSLLNMFFRSHLLFEAQLWIGLVLMCGFVLYDTQKIVEKVQHGDNDFVRHSLDLFVDAISIFKHILVLLTNKEVQRRDSDSRERRRR